MIPTVAPLRLSKRSQLVLLSLISAVIMAVVLALPTGGQLAIPILLITSYGIAIGIFQADMRHEEWLIMPLYLVLGSIVGFTWLKLYVGPGWMQLVGVGVYGVGIYLLSLTLNILNLATVRLLPLARTATTTFAMTSLALAFSLFYFALVYQLTIWQWTGSVVATVFLLSWPLLWVSLSPKGRLGLSLAWAAIVSGVVGELAMVVGLWPVSFMTSLFLTGTFGVIVGILHHQEKRLLTHQMLRQYFLVGGILLITLYLATTW